MQSDDIYPADWTIPYPATCDISAALRALEATELCYWSWDSFIWDLAKLRDLLRTRPVEFDYLYVTRFLKARAAYLARVGPFSSCIVTVLDGITRYRLQVAGIYRHLFMLELDRRRDAVPGKSAWDGRR